MPGGHGSGFTLETGEAQPSSITSPLGPVEQVEGRPTEFATATVGSERAVQDDDEPTARSEDASRLGNGSVLPDIRRGEGGHHGVRDAVREREGVGGDSNHPGAPRTSGTRRRQHRRGRLGGDPDAAGSRAVDGEAAGARAEFDDEPRRRKERKDGLSPTRPFAEEEPVGEAIVEPGAMPVERGEGDAAQSRRPVPIVRGLAVVATAR